MRDLGTALGSTGRFVPGKNNPDAFERHGFLKGVSNGFVEFAYAGFHQEIVRDRITPDHVRWASDLLGSLERAAVAGGVHGRRLSTGGGGAIHPRAAAEDRHRPDPGDQLTGRAKRSPIAISNPADSAQLSAHTAMALPVLR